MRFFYHFISISFAICAYSQFLSAPTGLTTTKGYAGFNVRWKEVPTGPDGICELNPKVKSYAGYVDVAADKHIHFVFYEARNVDPRTAPLTSWINGGPGSSSMIGQFQELGPCGVGSDGKPFNNPYSWSNASNMLFIDQPAQVGFSYSIPVPGYLNANGEVEVLPHDKCPGNKTCGTFSDPHVNDTETTTAAVAPAFWATLQGFMGAFPQYSRKGFHFATESYGGHYGPVINEYIEEQNAKNTSGAHQIKLETVMIGNGWYNPIIQYQAYYNFTVSPGNTYDYLPFTANQSTQMYDNLYGKGKCIDQLKHCAATGDNSICSKGDTYCANNVESLYDNYLNRDEYDFRELMPDPFPYGFYSAYLNTEKVLSAFGAATNYTDSSAAVGDAFGTTGDDGREDGTIEDIGKLLKQGITVMLYAGDADYNCNWLGGEVVSNEIDAPGFKDAGYVNLSTSDNIVHGQVRQSASFSFVRIYESGHEVPFYQPVAALAIFERAVKDLDIATGTQKAKGDYKTKGTSKSTYREGKSTIQFSVLNPNATYDTTTNEPGPPMSMHASKRRSHKKALKARGLALRDLAM